MSVSVIIPSHREEQWLNRTIANIFNTATGDIEIIVVLNGEWHPVDPRAKVIRLRENEGERVAMNMAVEDATGTHLLRIDAHCDFSPVGWDQMMEEVTGPRDMTQAVLTAVRLRWSMLSKKERARWLASKKTEGQWREWDRIPGHRYERCRLLPNYEAKWEDPNRDASLPTVIPNMSSTGCGFMIRKDFYKMIGGADESYPIMGGIGEEFSVKTWMHGGKVQTRTDVIIGHIFGTGAYDTDGVLEARRRLVERFGSRYGEIRCQFEDFDWGKDVRPTAVQSDGPRTVKVDRWDETQSEDARGQVFLRNIKHYTYAWIVDEHPDEKDLTDQEIEAKYRGSGLFMGEITLIKTDKGKWVDKETGKAGEPGKVIGPYRLPGEMIDQETGELAYTPIPPAHYQIPTDGPETCQPVDKTGK